MAEHLAQVIARMTQDPLAATAAAGGSRDALIQQAQRLTPEQIRELQRRAEIQRRLRLAQNRAMLEQLLDRHIGR